MQYEGRTKNARDLVTFATEHVYFAEGSELKSPANPQPVHGFPRLAE